MTDKVPPDTDYLKALSPEMSEFGVMFMQEMIQLAKQQHQQEQDGECRCGGVRRRDRL